MAAGLEPNCQPALRTFPSSAGRRTSSSTSSGATFPSPELYDSIVRGEIHSTGLIRVRNNSLLPDPAPGSGGWGAVRGEVSFDLRGPVLRFSEPLKVVTDRTELDVLPYMLKTYEFGDWTGVHIVGYIVIRR